MSGMFLGDDISGSTNHIDDVAFDFATSTRKSR